MLFKKAAPAYHGSTLSKYPVCTHVHMCTHQAHHTLSSTAHLHPKSLVKLRDGKSYLITSSSLSIFFFWEPNTSILRAVRARA